MLRPTLALLFGSLLCSLPASAASAQDAPRVDAPPAWVVETPLLDARPRNADPLSWRLADTQVRWDGHEREVYSRYVRRYLEESDIQADSQLSIEYDPSYQQVIFHHLVLRRGDQEIDQLASASFDVIRPERERGWQIYSGSETLVIFLHDLRKGDELDYAYSLLGSNPVFEDHLFLEVSLRFGVPLERFQYRLIVPAGSPLQVREFPAGQGLVESRLGDQRVLLWRADDCEAVDYESDTPAWYWDEPRLQVSNMASWGEVAEWALPVYAAALEGAAADLEINALARDIEAGHPEPAERAMAALRFVQDEIRYLGIELGENSHRPSPIEETLDRRFGDCKDKSVLLVALLRELGFDAAPAFVSSTRREHVERGLPSPAVFDHVIVRLRHAGSDLWLDATRLLQRGTLEQVGRADYGRALVVAEGQRGLATVAPRLLEEPTILSRQRFVIPEDGGSTELRITTLYRGESADWMRSTLAGYELAELTEQYLDHYDALYAGLEMREPLVVNDDQASNEITTRESYVIPDFFTAEDGAELPLASFYADGLSPYVYSSTERGRAAPFAVAYPVYVSQEILATIPGGWSLPDESERLDSPGMSFEYEASARGDQLELSWRYRSLADHVQPEHVAEHLERMQQAEDLLEFPVTLGSDPVNVMGAALGLELVLGVVMSVIMALAFVLTRSRRASTSSSGSALSTTLDVLELLGAVVRVLVLCALPVLVGLDWSDLFVEPGSAAGDAWALVFALLLGGYTLASTASLWAILFRFLRPRAYPWLQSTTRVAELALLAGATAAVLWLPGEQRALLLVCAHLALILPWTLAWTLRRPRMGATSPAGVLAE